MHGGRAAATVYRTGAPDDFLAGFRRAYCLCGVGDAE